MFCKLWVYNVNESHFIKCLICFVVTVVVSFLSFCRTLVPGRVCNGSN